ncbi:uncharacterized protein OCT59_028382 [Rhizophagus irregularis]|uniref:uncharacterized protein n=1 Tax=Rhizophagus irregularis TaxID=588596 RepID=UPI00332EA1EA|nr:hypothetical protein OCT59_028382 [Rhizophagus irregularis]
MIILPSGKTLIWKAVDISDQRGRAIDVIPKIEEIILNDLKEQSIKVACGICFSMNLVTRYEPSEETSSKSTELYFPTDICQIIIGDLFWSRISQLAILIKPYCGAFGKLQIDKAQLYDVALSFGYFIKFWEQNTDQFLSEGIISHFEKCWNNWEQFILLLSFVLHPKYHLDKFNPNLETINFVTIGIWLDYYYKAWTSEKPTKLLA